MPILVRGECSTGLSAHVTGVSGSAHRNKQLVSSGACLSQKEIWYVFQNGRCASIHARHIRWLQIFGPDQNEGCAVNEDYYYNAAFDIITASSAILG